jgi:hypothetical protein
MMASYASHRPSSAGQQTWAAAPAMYGYHPGFQSFAPTKQQ